MTIQTEDLREKVARIIDPTAFEPMTGHIPVQRQADALTKADAILALISSTKGGGDLEDLCGSGAANAKLQQADRALEEITKIKREPIGDTGFCTGPLAHFEAAKDIARQALSSIRQTGGV